MTTERWVGVAYVARELGVTPRTVERWCVLGTVPTAPRIGRSHWRIPLSWVREQRAEREAVSAAVQPIRRNRD